jgi:hypothetical protein
VQFVPLRLPVVVVAYIKHEQMPSYVKKDERTVRWFSGIRPNASPARYTRHGQGISVRGAIRPPG